MLIIGVLSIIPGLEGPTSTIPMLKVNTSYGLFMGLLPMNIFNKIALIAFGVAGIAVSRKATVNESVTDCKIVFCVMGTLAVLGAFHTTNTLGGYWPLFGGEILGHGLFALAAGACAVADAQSHESHEGHVHV